MTSSSVKILQTRSGATTQMMPSMVATTPLRGIRAKTPFVVGLEMIPSQEEMHPETQSGAAMEMIWFNLSASKAKPDGTHLETLCTATLATTR